MARTRSHVAEIELDGEPSTAFAALHTPSAVCAWWGADRVIVIARDDGLFCAAWGADPDRPDYVSSARIKRFDPPRVMEWDDQRYYASEGESSVGDDMTTRFDVIPEGRGCRLRVVQDGFPDDPSADELYAACEKGWRDTLRSFKRFVES